MSKIPKRVVAQRDNVLAPQLVDVTGTLASGADGGNVQFLIRGVRVG